MCRRKRDVQKERQPRRRLLLAYAARRQHELVVVHPHQLGARRRRSGGRVGEALVDAAIGGPAGGVEARAVGETVEQRPQGSVGETVIERLHLGRAHAHRHDAVGQRRRWDRLIAVQRHTWPADPYAAAPFQHRLERRHQPARRAPHGHPVAAPFERDRQAVGDDHCAPAATTSARVPLPVLRPA